jgi:hypothetical protein
MADKRQESEIKIDADVGATRTTRTRGRVNLNQPDRDMTVYKISSQELAYLGLSSGVGSASLGAAVFFYKKYAELANRTPRPDSDWIAQTYATMSTFAAFAAVLYLVFFGTVFMIKWNSGRRWWRLIF